MNSKFASAILLGLFTTVAMAQEATPPPRPLGSPPPAPMSASAPPPPTVVSGPVRPATPLALPNMPSPPDGVVSLPVQAPAAAVTRASALSPAATTPIPNGYLRVQSSPTARAQSRAQHIAMARQIAAVTKRQNQGAQVPGVALVDRENGQIVALVTAEEITAAAQAAP